jgi:hypothetical protein
MAIKEICNGRSRPETINNSGRDLILLFLVSRPKQLMHLLKLPINFSFHPNHPRFYNSAVIKNKLISSNSWKKFNAVIALRQRTDLWKSSGTKTFRIFQRCFISRIIPQFRWNCSCNISECLGITQSRRFSIIVLLGIRIQILPVSPGL